ncbi:MAG: hypothetical protein HYZ71_04690 [Deltaproteobacteria bacterium]|nr:hypothetical protein [Deltaproteobacteria bacterium]
MEVVLVFVFSLFLAGCGVETLAQETKTAVQAGNSTQEEIRRELERTEKLTQSLNDLMEKTANGVHLQVLTVALEQMLSPRNTAVLAPPVRMMPYAQAFANEASPLEMIQTAHLLYTDAILSPDTEKEFRIASIVAMSLLGAFTSSEKVAQIEDAQITRKGRFELTTYVFLTGRYMALRDYFLGDILDNLPTQNFGTLREAIGYFSPMSKLAHASYSSLLAVDIDSLGIHSQVDPTEIKSIGNRANKRFKQTLPADVLTNADVVVWLQTFLDA